MFYVLHSASGACEIQVDFRERSANQLSSSERRAFMYLNSSLRAVNSWLAVLAADPDYAAGTVMEYAKVLWYALEWLAQEPMRLSTQEPVRRSLLNLEPPDARALLAWLAIPTKRRTERLHLVKTGVLPPGYRQNLLTSATRHVRRAALLSFYDWLLQEYLPFEEASGLPRHPIRSLGKRYHPIASQEQGFTDLSPSSLEPPHQRAVRWTGRDRNQNGPVVLTLPELRLVFETIPAISHGQNAANRNGALIRFMLWGMLRESEVVGAGWEAVDGELLYVLGKGQKRRVVPLVEASSWSYLHTYTSELRLPPEQQFHGALFRQLDHEERPITKHTVEHLVLALKDHFQRAADRAAALGEQLQAQSLRQLAKKLHTHIFRATGATLMAAAGMHLVSLSLLLGHADPGTTQRYYIAAEQLALSDAVRKICAGIITALEGLSSTEVEGHTVLPNPYSWYQRRGYLKQTAGGHDE